MLGCDSKSLTSQRLRTPTSSSVGNAYMLPRDHGTALYSIEQLVTRATWQVGTSQQPLGFGTLSGGSYRRCCGRSRSGRPPFAVNLVTISKTPGWVTPVTAGGGGEVLPVRAPALPWRSAPGKSQSGSESSQQAALPAVSPAVSVSSTSNPLSTHEGNGRQNLTDHDSDRRISTPNKAREVKGTHQRSSLSLPKKLTHRRRVTWSGNIETVEVERTSPSEIFSPDLHVLAIAEQLAVAADEPRVAEAARAVLAARREVAAIVRSLSANDGWSGRLDGVEDQWRMWARREFLSMQETDELVRYLVSPHRRNSEGAGEVYRLKDAYRAARRRMDNAGSDD